MVKYIVDALLKMEHITKKIRSSPPHLSYSLVSLNSKENWKCYNSFNLWFYNMNSLLTLSNKKKQSYRATTCTLTMYEQVDAMYHRDTGGGYCAIGQIFSVQHEEKLCFIAYF